VEFAATFAQRVVLLGTGEVVANGGADELLSGGWYFSTEVARILDGAAMTPEQGVAVLEEGLGLHGGAPAEAFRGAAE
jgi:energy-coupling factor transport system ATP-binding protein